MHAGKQTSVGAHRSNRWRYWNTPRHNEPNLPRQIRESWWDCVYFFANPVICRVYREGRTPKFLSKFTLQLNLCTLFGEVRYCNSCLKALSRILYSVSWKSYLCGDLEHWDFGSAITSASAAPAVTVDGELRDAGQWRLLHYGWGGSKAVSYTHLTLPTNREV